MNIAAYCRVSTDKSDQLNSLEAQKKFFAEFTERNGHNLVRLYADEGISGTKIKNRKEFQKLMRDAKQGLFDMVVVKDISRFARNTVDFLQSIRALKALGIEEGLNREKLRSKLQQNWIKQNRFLSWNMSRKKLRNWKKRGRICS